MRQIHGTAIKTIEVQWFKWSGYNTTHLLEIQTWLEGAGLDPSNFIAEEVSKEKPKLIMYKTDGNVFEIEEDSIIVIESKGLNIISEEEFNNKYTKQYIVFKNE